MIMTVLVIVGISVAAVLGMFAMGWWSDRNRVQKEGATVNQDEGTASRGNVDTEQIAA